jgi:hypothetical protein
MSRSFLLINGVIVVTRLVYKQNCVSEFRRKAAALGRVLATFALNCEENAARR